MVMVAFWTLFFIVKIKEVQCKSRIRDKIICIANVDHCVSFSCVLICSFNNIPYILYLHHGLKWMFH